MIAITLIPLYLFIGVGIAYSILRTFIYHEPIKYWGKPGFEDGFLFGFAVLLWPFILFVLLPVMGIVYSIGWGGIKIITFIKEDLSD